MLRTHTTVFSMVGQIPRAEDVEKHSDVEVGDLAEATPELGGVPQHGEAWCRSGSHRVEVCRSIAGPEVGRNAPRRHTPGPLRLIMFARPLRVVA